MSAAALVASAGTSRAADVLESGPEASTEHAAETLATFAKAKRSSWPACETAMVVRYGINSYVLEVLRLSHHAVTIKQQSTA